VTNSHSSAVFTKKCRPTIYAFFWAHSLAPVLALVAFALIAFCPTVSAQNYLSATGTPSFSAPEPVEYGFTETTNGNLHLEFPLGSFPQRGTKAPYNLRLMYDSHIWQIYTSGCCSLAWGISGNGGFNGWTYTSATTGSLTEADLGWQACGADFTWTDGYATTHYFALPSIETVSSSPNQCPTTGDAFATDSSGFHLYYNYTGYAITIYAPDGTRVWSQTFSGHEIDSQGHIVLVKDANGNYFSQTNDSNNWVLDTLERIPAKLSACAGGGSCYLLTNSQSDTSRSQFATASATIAVNTAFGQSGVTEYSGNITVTQSITLPDGSSFSFKYDCDSTLNSQVCSSPHGQGAYYGVMTSMTLPTGGQVTYGYTTFSDSYSNRSRWLSSRTSAGGAWSYTPQVISTCSSTQVGCQEKETISKPDGSYAVNTFTLDNGAWLTQTQQYDNQSNLMGTTATTWDFSNACVLLGCHGHNFIREVSETATVPIPGGTSVTRKTAYSYDTPQKGNVTAIQEWGFYPGTSPTFPSVPDRATYLTYYSTGTNIINKPLSLTLCNNSGSDSSCLGGGSKVSQTLVTYDSYGAGLTSITGVANHDDTNFGVSYTARGNPTTIQQWVSGSTYLTTQNQFDTTGQVIQSTDPVGNPTSLSYSDNYFTETGATSTSAYSPTYATNTFPKTITMGGFTWTFGYYFGDGKQALSTDPNNLTAYSYIWDPDDRPTEMVYPIGWSLTNYTSATQIDSYAPVGDTSPSTSCTSCQHNEVTLDGYGRKINEKLANAPGAAINVDTAYDGKGRVQSVSHVYTTGPVYETYSYDGLDRQTAVTHPDNQFSSVAFGPNVTSLGGISAQQGSGATYGYGYPVITVDESGTKKQQKWVDGFGRIIEVDEPTTGQTPGSGSVSISGAEQSTQVCHRWLAGGDCQQWITVYDHGTVSITVNGVLSSVSYGSGSTSSSITTALASAINSNGSINSLVSASASSSTVTIIAKQGGSQTNYSLSAAATTGDPTDFPDGSFYTSASGSALSGGFNAGSLFSAPQVTLYKYDAAGRLTQVVQGLQTRSFAYDGLGRLTSRTTPEAGTENLYFTNSSGGLCAGSGKALCRRTDARGITTTYTYDSLSRLTGKSYSNGQGSVTLQYDQGGAGAFALTRLTTVTDPSGSETYTYDQVGRVTQVQKTIGTTTFPIGYQYDPGNYLTQITYPSGRVVQQSLDNIGRLQTVSSSGTNYVSVPSTNGYNAAGQILTFTYGNGVAANFSYSPLRQQLQSLSYTSGSNTLFSLNYYYQYDATNCIGGNSANDGQIACVSDAVDSGRNVAYGYDALARLTTASTKGSSGYAAWGMSEGFDRYGNRLNQSQTAGSPPTNSLTFATTPAPPANPPGGAYTNRPDGFSFDASGNMLNDGNNNLSFNAENCLITAANSGSGTSTYTCDAHGIRVKKVLQNGTSTAYVFAGKTDVAEYDYTTGNPSPSSPSREYIYAGGRLTATIQGSSTIYHHSDHLSVRVTSDVNGNKIGEQGHYPYGEQWYVTSTTSKFIFTSYERDAESGNDYAMARYYVNRFARFCSADPLMGSPGDPQSWNRYAYVRNDPINAIDPTGQSVFSWIVKAFQAIAAFLFGPPLSSGAGTPPIIDNGPLSDTTGLLTSLYHPISLSKFATPTFLDPGTDYFSLPAAAANAVANPCAGYTSATLNYFKKPVTPYEDGSTNAFQHIWTRHIIPNLDGASLYFVPKAQTAPEEFFEAWEAARLANAITFDKGAWTVNDDKSITYEYTFTAGDPLGRGYISNMLYSVGSRLGNVRGQAGGTLTNTLIVSDCTTPRTSFPGRIGD
jgi:RHS repeat-associated protein